MCVMLHEKQSDIIRGLKKVATAARVDVDLDSPGEAEEVREEVRDKIELLDKLESKLTLLDGLARRVGVVEAHVEAGVGKEPAAQRGDQGTAVEKRDVSPELGTPGATNSRKRKSAGGAGSEERGPRVIVDLSGGHRKRDFLAGKGPSTATTAAVAAAAGSGNKRSKLVSHSPEVLEVPESEVEVDVEEDEEEDEEERIKSPIEKKRRGARAAAGKASRLGGRLNA